MGSSAKRMKDPVYGYIELDKWVCDNVIDTPEFQRLRRVVQTSYAPLYPSALHNRFVHSLGVYHLGCRAADVLNRSVEQLLDGEEACSDILEHWKLSLTSFKVACLLHDFGHAPFSHTGEQFFDPQQNYLSDELIERVGDDDFRGEAEQGKFAAPHEIMSAMLGIDTFSSEIPNVDLFARAITGLKYSDAEDSKRQLDNILIVMLNSTTIDVDKLDYLIRDSYVVGFDSVQIDYERLLDGLRVVRIAGEYTLAYDKSALSVLENVVYARDFEKKWIQSHPAVLYDQMLVEHSCQVADDAFRGGKPRFEMGSDGKELLWPSLFSESALTGSGAKGSGGRLVRWVADEDVVYLAKNECNDDALVGEYFSRKARRHPLWKSEAEYRAAFDVEGPEMKRLADLVASIAKWASDKGCPLLLNDDLIEMMKADREKKRASKKSRISDSTPKLSRQIRFLEGLRVVCVRKGLSFDFALIGSESFRSGFRGGSFSEINILFPEAGGGIVRQFKTVSNPITYADVDFRYFYLYHVDASSLTFPKDEIVGYLANGWAEVSAQHS